MNLKLETEFSKAPLLQEIGALKKQIDSMRPLPPDVEGRVMQKLRLDWNYNSNAIEGNKLSYGETTALLMHGITAKGKPLKDHLDIQGHNQAVEYLERLVKDGRDFTESDIRALHEVLLVKPDFTDAQTAEGLPTRKRIEIGKYKSLPNHVKTRTGEIHYYATPEETPALMNDLMSWYVQVSEVKEIHPVVIAALFHHRFVAIHPFDDGNGRMARILMNLILMKSGYPVVVIKDENKDDYYSLLSRADVGDAWPFVSYIIEMLENSLNLYIKASSGGDIDDDDDIDKEIALFKLELQGKIQLKEKKTIDVLKRVIQNNLLQVFDIAIVKSNEFNEFFFGNIKFIHLDYISLKDEEKKVNLIFGHPKLELENDFKEVKDSYFFCQFTEFKNANAFNIKIVWNIKFEEYRYVILNKQGEEILSKFYHETISKMDQQYVAKILIALLKENIQKNL